MVSKVSFWSIGGDDVYDLRWNGKTHTQVKIAWKRIRFKWILWNKKIEGIGNPGLWLYTEHSYLFPVCLRGREVGGMFSLKVSQCNVFQVMVTLTKAEVEVDEASSPLTDF